MRLEVTTVEEVFFHCAKAFLRSEAWKPETWDPTAVPTDEQLDDYYREANLRKMLY